MSDAIKRYMRGGVIGSFARGSVCKSSIASVQTHDVATDGKKYTTGWGLAIEVRDGEIKDV